MTGWAGGSLKPNRYIPAAAVAARHGPPAPGGISRRCGRRAARRRVTRRTE